MKKKNIALFSFALITTIIFFTYKMVVTYDSSHYLWLSSLLCGVDSFKQWDVARGIVFPMIIKMGTSVFGTNSSSFLVVMYLAYLFMLACCYKLFKESVKTESKFIKLAVVTIFSVMVVFNPMIFGYYHTLLTEFIAITIAVAFCYIAWKFMYIDFKEDKKIFILYTLAFSLGAMFMWHLKQPYVGTVIFPLFVASLISIIRNFKLKNIIQRIVVCLIALISIAISIIFWNMAIKLFGVEINAERTSGGLFSKQLISGVSSYRVRTKQEEVYTKEAIDNDKFISEADKKIINDIFNGTSEKYKSFLILEKFEAPGKVSDKKVIFSESDDIQMKETVKYFLQTLKESPTEYISNLTDNYLTIANVYGLDMTDNIFFIEKNNISWETVCENSIIGYRIYKYDESNVFPVSPKLQPYVNRYMETQRPIVAVNFVMQKLEVVSTLLFKVAIVILPFYLVGLVVVQIVFRKKYDDEFKKTLDLAVILATYSFLHILLHVFLAAFIDRYAMPTTVTLYVSYILAFYLIFKAIKNK